jgi:hypothetical protein
MSLFLIDLAYIGVKGIYTIGYYTVKFSYNSIAYMTGSEYMVDKEVIDTNQLVLQELKELRREISVLKIQKELTTKKAYIADTLDFEPEIDNTLEPHIVCFEDYEM